MAAVAVLHHDEPALQGFGMANDAGRHLSGGCLKHLLHEYRAIGEMSVLAIGGNSPGRCIDDMQLLRTLGPCEPPPPSFPTTDRWCDRHRVRANSRPRRLWPPLSARCPARSCPSAP